MPDQLTPRRPWSRTELLVAMHLYFQMPFGTFHSRNKVIINTAKCINRTPSSLAMKLCNIASLDHVHQSRGVTGLSGASNQDRAIWNEFKTNWTVMVEESAKALAMVTHSSVDSPSDATSDSHLFQTETESTVIIRKGQGFFRAAVLTAYSQTCCMTGCRVPSLLVASHIVPWSADEQNRLNPRNGLCLAPLQDKVFDRGLIGLSDDLEVLASTHLLGLKDDPLVKSQIIPLIGSRITLPERLAPDINLIRRHRETVFRGNG